MAAHPPHVPTAPPAADPGAVLPRLAGHEALRLRGEPLLHPIRQLADVFGVAWMCNDSLEAEVIIDLPERGADEPLPPLPLAALIGGAPEGRRLRVGFDRSGLRFHVLRCLSGLGALWSWVPDGARVELVTAYAGEDDPEGARGSLHRFAGVVREGQWAIEAVYPRVSREAFAGALALACGWVGGGTRIPVRDSAEADLVMAACEADFALEDARVSYEHGAIVVDDDVWTPEIALILFRARHLRDFEMYVPPPDDSD